ncbi:hypothetical protein D3C74_419700 [compost metagenome]
MGNRFAFELRQCVRGDDRHLFPCDGAFGLELPVAYTADQAIADSGSDIAVRPIRSRNITESCRSIRCLEAKGADNHRDELGTGYLFERCERIAANAVKDSFSRQFFDSRYCPCHSA